MELIMLKKIRNMISFLIQDMLRGLSGSLGIRLRYAYYSKKLGHLGKGVVINMDVYFLGPEGIHIGDNTHIDKGCYLISGVGTSTSGREIIEKKTELKARQHNKIFIGKNCHIGKHTHIHGYGGVYFGDSSVTSYGVQIHSISSLPRSPASPGAVVSIVPYTGQSPSLIGNIIFGDNCWLGLNTIVLPGVSIDQNSFVRSNSLVDSSFSENSYIAGDPAVQRGKRYKMDAVGPKK